MISDTASVSTTNAKSNSITITSQISQSISSVTNSGPTTTTNITTGAVATQTTSPSNSNISGAAIAGAVVGPICGVALLLGLVFLFLRQRRSKPPAAEASPASWPPPSDPIAPFGDYTAGKSMLDAVNAPNSHRPVSIPPAYPGTGNVETVVATNDMPLPTMSHGTEVAAHLPVPIGPQSEAQVQQQTQSQQVPARRPVVAELGTNPRVRGMPPELPAGRRQ